MPHFNISLSIVLALLIGYIVGAKWPGGAQSIGVA